MSTVRNQGLREQDTGEYRGAKGTREENKTERSWRGNMAVQAHIASVLHHNSTECNHDITAQNGTRMLPLFPPARNTCF